MVARRGPTLRAQWLGQELRKLREDAKLTLKDVGVYIQRDASSVSRMEAGIFPARVPEVLAYVNLCGVSGKQRRDALITLAQGAWQKGWWDGYTDDVAGVLIDKIWLENRARTIRTFHGMSVFGLLQTREYAEALIRTVSPDASEAQIKRWLDLRMSRQEILAKDDPAHVAMILDEIAIRRPVGGPTVAAGQLRHLVDIAARPNTEVRILPLTAGAHASPEGSFEIFQMDEPYSDVGYVETPAGAIWVESSDVDQLAARYDQLHDHALGTDDSIALMKAIADDTR